MGRLQHRLPGVVVAIGILTTLSVVVADLGAPEPAQESLQVPESRTGADQDATLPANQTVPTVVTPRAR